MSVLEVNKVAGELPWKGILTEVWMRLSLLRCQPLLVVVPEKFVQEIDRRIRYVSLIFRCHEPTPWLLLVTARESGFASMPITIHEPAQDVVVLCVEFDVILLKILE